MVMGIEGTIVLACADADVDEEDEEDEFSNEKSPSCKGIEHSTIIRGLSLGEDGIEHGCLNS